MNALEYAKQLAQSAGLDAEQEANFLKVVANEKISKSLEEGMMLRSDYSRNMDSLKAEQQKTTAYYADLLKWKDTEQAKVDAALANAGNGDHAVVQPVQSDFVSKKDMEAELARREGLTISLLKDGLKLATTHMWEFKEPLDTDALAKVAVERGMTLSGAYAEMVGPRRAEIQAATRKTELEAARAEGAREFASKHKIPVDTTAREAHVLLERDPSGKKAGITDYVPNSGQLTPQSERHLRDSFVDTYNQASAVGTSGT